MVANRFLPNIGDVAAGRKELAWPDAAHFDTLVAARALNGVLDGCVVSAGGGTREIDVKVGCVVIDGVAKTVAAQQVGPLDTGVSQGNPRIDLITVNTSGTLVVTKGAVAAVPEIPLIPASSVVLGVVLIIDGQATIVDGDINDMGIDLSRQPFVMHRTVTEIGPENEVTEQSLFTYTLPGRALGTGGGVRVTILGNLVVAASATLGIKIKLGATELFSSGTQTHISNNDPRSWKMVIDLMADGAFAAQKVWAEYTASQPLSSQFLAFVGSSGDERLSKGFVEATEDMSADRLLDVTAKFSVAHVFNDMKMQHAYVERLPPA